MDSSITTATETGGGLMLASFGSGDTTGQGRLGRRAVGRARTQSASAAEVRAARSRIQRAGTTGRGRDAATRRRLLQEIADNTTSRGKIRRGVLADIVAELP